jgi:uncharacterized protein
MASAKVRVRVHPGAQRDEFVRVNGGVVVARVAAPPLEGRANKALCRLVAKRLGIAPSRVSIVSGSRSREKLLHIEGLDQALVDAELLA